MGTSTKLPGPRGSPWDSSRRQFQRWSRGSTQAIRQPVADHDPSPAQLEQAERIAHRYRQALATTLRFEPDLSGLRPTGVRAGNDLVQALGELLGGTSSLAVSVPGTTGEEREDQFVARFVSTVGGSGGLVSDAVARRAARRTAEELLARDSQVKAVIRNGGGSVRITGDLFCGLYQLFFGEYVGEFIKTVIAEAMPLAIPLTLPIDPTGLVASAVSSLVIKALPDPCAEAAGREPRGGLLVRTARDLVTETVEHALGIREDEEGHPWPLAGSPTTTQPAAG